MQQQVGTRLWGKKWGNTGVLIKTSSNFMSWYVLFRKFFIVHCQVSFWGVPASSQAKESKAWVSLKPLVTPATGGNARNEMVGQKSSWDLIKTSLNCIIFSVPIPIRNTLTWPKLDDSGWMSLDASGLRMYLKRIEAQTKSLEDNKAGVIEYATLVCTASTIWKTFCVAGWLWFWALVHN